MGWKNLLIWRKKLKIPIINNIYKTVLSYCLKYRKNTESKNPKFVRTKNVRIMLLSKCSVWNSKKFGIS